MRPLIAFASPAFEALTTALLHSLWVGAVIAGALAITRLSVMRHASPKARYRVAFLALLGMTAVTSWLFRGALTTSSTVHQGIPEIVITEMTSASFSLKNESPFMAMVWMVGAVVALLRNLGGWWRLKRICQSAQPVNNPALIRAFDLARARLGIREKVRLRTSSEIDSPLMAGFFWPTVLIPIALLQGAPVNYLQAVFAHELAHHRRWDYVSNLLQCLIESLFFYHPAVWWISRIIREERERACDDLAVARSVNLQDYAGALAWMESLRQPADSSLPAPAMAIRPGSTLARIERLIRQPISPSATRRSLDPSFLPGLSTAAVTVAIVCMLASPPRLSASFPESSAPPSASAKDSTESWFERLREDLNLIQRAHRFLDETYHPWPETSIDLFSSPVTLEKNGKLIRLDDEKPRVFAEFPNQYLRDHRLNFLDGNLPASDPDHDGFSVLEEFRAGTDPKSAESHPPLTDRLSFVARLKRLYRIRYDGLPDGRHAQLTRLPSAIWSQQPMYLAEGDSSPDAQISVQSITPSNVAIIHRPSGTRYLLEKRKTVEIPTWFAQMNFDLETPSILTAEKGEIFSLGMKPEKQYRLTEITDSSAIIIPLADGEPVSESVTLDPKKEAKSIFP